MNLPLFSADLHFGARGALKYRHWANESVEAMNIGLIQRWNVVADDNSVVYVLGDLSFAGKAETLGYLAALRGKEIHIVPGNHDRPEDLAWLAEAHNRIIIEPPLLDLKVTVNPEGEPLRLVLCHYPLLSWNKMHYGALHLHGHCHGNLSDDGVSRRMDVGVDGHGSGHAPWTVPEIQKRLCMRVGRYFDHHTPKAAGEQQARASVTADKPAAIV